jgi:hypothetical protein
LADLADSMFDGGQAGKYAEDRDHYTGGSLPSPKFTHDRTKITTDMRTCRPGNFTRGAAYHSIYA